MIFVSIERPSNNWHKTSIIDGTSEWDKSSDWKFGGAPGKEFL